MPIQPTTPRVLPPARRYNAVQKHGSFFDENNDHKITVGETRRGLQALGMGGFKGWLVGLITNVGLALPQKNVKTVELDRILAQMNPLTPGAFTPEGEFDAEKFEKMFTYDVGKTGSLSQDEVKKLIDESRLDDRGKFRTKAGYSALFSVAADTTKPSPDGKGTVPAISRERMKSFFTGTIFHDIAASRGNRRPMWDGLTYGLPPKP